MSNAIYFCIASFAYSPPSHSELVIRMDSWFYSIQMLQLLHMTSSTCLCFPFTLVVKNSNFPDFLILQMCLAFSLPLLLRLTIIPLLPMHFQHTRKLNEKSPQPKTDERSSGNSLVEVPLELKKGLLNHYPLLEETSWPSLQLAYTSIGE